MTSSLTLALALVCMGADEAGYEDRLIQWGLAQHQRTIEPHPDGKTIEEILVSSETVISQSDPWPNWFNWIHMRTRESVVRREVLVQPGMVWTPERIQETSRNLRRLFFIAVARIVPVVGKNGGVAVLVITKDRWSLRLSNSFSAIGPLLQFLQLQLNEINFLGWGQQLTLDMQLRLDTLSLGQYFIERRLFGSRFFFGEAASIIINRQTGAAEGTQGQVVFGRPLISLNQPWGFLVSGDWNLRRRRIFRGANVWALPYPDETSTDTVPFIYDVRDFSVNGSFTKRWGTSTIVDLQGVIGGYQRQYTPPVELPADKAAWLTWTRLPRSERVTSLGASVSAFQANYQVLKNVDAFELSEDFQIGWWGQAAARWAIPLPFAPSNFIEAGGLVRYRLYAKDDLLTVHAAASVRFRPGLSPANEHIAVLLSNYSPRVFGGRIYTRVVADFRANDLDNTQLFLGGTSGLRGAVAEQFAGRNLLLANLEYRTRPFEILTTWIGLVWFYDVGSAFNNAVSVTHTVGMGVRILLPQLNKDVLRFDIGVVIAGPVPGLDRLSAGWGQVNQGSWGQVANNGLDYLSDPLRMDTSTVQ